MTQYTALWIIGSFLAGVVIGALALDHVWYWMTRARRRPQQQKLPLTDVPNSGKAAMSQINVDRKRYPVDEITEDFCNTTRKEKHEPRFSHDLEAGFVVQKVYRCIKCGAYFHY